MVAPQRRDRERTDGAPLPSVAPHRRGVRQITGPLRLFFAMPLATALDLRTRILRSTVSVTARTPGAKTEVTLASEDEPVVGGITAASAMAPRGRTRSSRSARISPGRSSSRSSNIPNLDRLATWGRRAAPSRITIRLATPLPKALSLEASAIRLHCVPAVNVHTHPSINTPLVRSRCALDVGEVNVFTIEQVTLVNDDL